MSENKSSYPEHDKIDADQAILLSAFLDSIAKKFVIGEQEVGMSGEPVIKRHARPDELIANFFEVDVEKFYIEKEKMYRELLN